MGDWLMDEEAAFLGETLSLLASWDPKEEEAPSATVAIGGNARLQEETEMKTTTSRNKSHAKASATRATAAVRTRSKTEENKQPNTNSSDAQAVALMTTKPTRSTRINYTRERRKQEIEMLRSESTQLQDRLCALQRRRSEMLKPHFSGRAMQSTAPIWESMARRQFQTRRRAEEYNATLRQEIQTQTQVSDALMNAIQLAMQRQTLQDKRPKMRLPIDVSQRLSEEELVQRLDYNFPRWQRALSLSPKFERGELQFMDFHVVRVDGKTATLGLYTSRTLPYPVTQVASVGWWMFQQETSGYGEDEDDEEVDKYVQEIKTPNDTIIAVFTMESTMGGATAKQGTIHGKWVAKQAALQIGAQHLISTTWQYELGGFGNELDGVSVVEDTWLRIVDAKDIGHAQLAGPVAVLQHVRRLQIHFNRSEPVDKAHTNIVTELFIKEIRGELKVVDRALENNLMAQSVKRK